MCHIYCMSEKKGDKGVCVLPKTRSKTAAACSTCRSTLLHLASYATSPWVAGYQHAMNPMMDHWGLELSEINSSKTLDVDKYETI